MAFAIRNLSVLAYANGFTLWHYKAGRDRLDRVRHRRRGGHGPAGIGAITALATDAAALLAHAGPIRWT